MTAVRRAPSVRALTGWAFALGIGGIIWYVSSLPLHGPVFESASKKGFDKVAHAVEYGLFATLLFEAMRRTFIGRGRVKRALLIAAFFAGIFAVADEIHQLAVPYRSCDVTDAWADLAGVAAALGIRTRKLSTKHA